MLVQGVYTTFYGPHGMEALHVTYGLMDPPLSSLLPHGKCFAGLKVRPWAFGILSRERNLLMLCVYSMPKR